MEVKALLPLNLNSQKGRSKINQLEAMRITGLSDKTLKILTDSLIKLELLESRKES